MNFIQCPFCNCEYRIDPEISGNTIKCQKCEKNFEVKNIYKKERRPSFEDLAVAYDVITREQLDEAVSIKRAEEQLGNIVAIEDILVQKGMVNGEQMGMLKEINQFIETRALDKKFGKIAMTKGILTEKEVKLALSVQAVNFKKKKYCRLIGDILIESGVMNEKQRDDILIEQKRLDGKLPKGGGSEAGDDGPVTFKEKLKTFVTDVREANIQNLIVTFTQRRALIVIAVITAITIGLIVLATTVKPTHYRNISENSLMDKLLHKDARHYLYPFKFSTTLADHAFFNIEMDVEFTDINGFEEFERKSSRLRHAFNLVFSPRNSNQIKSEKRIPSTLKKIIEAQMELDITDVHVTKYVLTEPEIIPESEAPPPEGRSIDDTAFKLFKLK